MLACALVLALPLLGEARELEVAVERLEVSGTPRGLELKWRVGDRNLAMLQSHGLSPRLAIYGVLTHGGRERRTYLYAVALDRSRGRARVPLDGALYAWFDLEPVGFEREHRISGMRWPGGRGQVLRVAPQALIEETRGGPHGHGHGPGPGWPPVGGGLHGPPPPGGDEGPSVAGPGSSPNLRPDALVRACGEEVVGSEAVASCMESISRAQVGYPLEAIRACGAATTGDRELLQCLTALGGLGLPPGPIVRACDEATMGAEALRQCLELSPRWSHQGPSTFAEVVRACDAATMGDASLQRCLVGSERLGALAPATIAQCDAVTMGDGPLERCVAAAR